MGPGHGEILSNTNLYKAEVPNPYKGHLLGEWHIGPLHEAPPSFVSGMVREVWGWFGLRAESWPPKKASLELINTFRVSDLAGVNEPIHYQDIPSLALGITFKNHENGVKFKNPKEDFLDICRHLFPDEVKSANVLDGSTRVLLNPFRSLKAIYPLEEVKVKCDKKLFLVGASAWPKYTRHSWGHYERTIDVKLVFKDLESVLIEDVEHAQKNLLKLRANLAKANPKTTNV